MEIISLFDTERKESPVEIVPIDGGDCLYHASQIPAKLGFKFSSSALICVDGNSLSEAINRAGDAVKKARSVVHHCNLECDWDYPYIELCDANISVSVRAVINGDDGCPYTFILTAMCDGSDENAPVVVSVDASRGKFLVRI